MWKMRLRLLTLVGAMWIAAGAGWASAVNVALSSLGGVASESNPYDTTLSPAAHCNDGNTDGNYFNLSVCATTNDGNEWWEVTFAADYNIVRFDIFNRTDCCADRVNPFTLFLYDGAHTQVWTSGSGLTMTDFGTFAVPNVTARTARLQLDRTDFLNLAEIEVFSDSSPAPEPGTLSLLAMGVAAGLSVWRKCS